MKGKLVTKLFSKYFSLELPDYCNKGGLIYYNNLDYYLKGLWFESSSFSAETFTIEVFIQPLVIPADGYILNIGSRLGVLDDRRDIWWTYSKEKETEIVKDIMHRIKRDAQPFFNKFSTPVDFINTYHINRLSVKDRYKYETYIYFLVLLGNYTEAEMKIPRFYNHLEKLMNDYPYLLPVCDRLNKLLTLLIQKDYKSALDLVESYRMFTLESLNLFNHS